MWISYFAVCKFENGMTAKKKKKNRLECPMLIKYKFTNTVANLKKYWHAVSNLYFFKNVPNCKNCPKSRNCLSFQNAVKLQKQWAKIPKLHKFSKKNFHFLFYVVHNFHELQNVLQHIVHAYFFDPILARSFVVIPSFTSITIRDKLYYDSMCNVCYQDI